MNAPLRFVLLLSVLLLPALASAYYNPVQGRWCSMDPIEGNGGTNLYGFVGNTPPNALDPHGLELLVKPHSYSIGRDGSRHYRGVPVADASVFAQKILAAFRELSDSCCFRLKLEWAGQAHGVQGKRFEIYRITYDMIADATGPATSDGQFCCSEIRKLMDSKTKFSIGNLEETNNAYGETQGKERKVYVNPEVDVALPAGKPQGNSASPPFTRASVPLPVVLFHEAVGHSQTQMSHPQIPENGVPYGGASRAASGNPAFLDPVIELENIGRSCLRASGRQLGNRRPFYYGPD